MAKISGLSQDFFIGGYPIGGDIGAINSAGGPRAVQDVSAIDKAAMERILLRGNGLLEFLVFFNDATDRAHLGLSTLLTANRAIIWALGRAIGDPALGMLAKQINYDWTKNPDGSVQGVVNAEADGVAMEWGKMLTPGLVTHTVATNGASQQDSLTTAGIAAYLNLAAFTGTNITVAIQQSTDNGVLDAWTAALTFTQQTAANQSERKTATGTIDNYLRVSSTGTFTSAQIAVAYRRGTAEDDAAY